MKSNEIRTKFIDFFKSKGHVYAEPSPVIQNNDPTLLFTNAGMNQFKDIFLGNRLPDFARAVNSQVCIRISGKHNDLEEVGKDFTHLTLFEMLGNWSFGDYYKKEAITWAWEFLIEILHFPKEKLYATVFHTDSESLNYWQKFTNIDHSHIRKFHEKDNFWEMAEIGPCGPCSEIHIDLGLNACQKKQEIGHLCDVNGDCGRFVELWNLVFIAYNRNADGSLIDLPSKHVDTGAGLERIAAFLQNTNSNYNTDLFKPIINQIELLSKVPYQDNLLGMPHRVVADHIRTLCFAIADNVFPSNEGRGYVLRRLLRRALRYLKKLGVNEPLLYQLVDPVVEVMGDYYVNLRERRDLIKSIIQKEEVGFLRTLDAGLDLFYAIVEKSKNRMISGKDAFKLYDTFGFPIDLTIILAEENNLTVDLIGFEAELAKQKARSRENTKLKSKDADSKAIGGEVKIAANAEEKLLLARHHTATHLLQAALRKFLGLHVQQAGSLVDIDYLRFDFSHFSKVDPTILQEIEDAINFFITQVIPIEFLNMSLYEAKKLGALALFGEKYSDIVRVVKICDVSLELCGGNHVKNTLEIEKVKIISESAIASGVRRIVAIAGTKNIADFLTKKKQEEQEFINTRLSQLENIIKEIILNNEEITFDLGSHKFCGLDVLIYFKSKSAEKSEIGELTLLRDQIQDFIKLAEKRLNEVKIKSVQANILNFLKEAKEIKPGIFLLIKSFEEIDLNQLRIISDSLANANENLVMVLSTCYHAKVNILVKIGDGVLKELNFSAMDLVYELSILASGKGGGKASFATMGNVDINKLPKALIEIERFIKEKIDETFSN
ncbi:MAG: alanine--tRNA ligase [Candidatus Margulisiibacteriota bacterium]|jgi:alanyl-tRNA synthetase